MSAMAILMISGAFCSISSGRGNTRGLAANGNYFASRSRLSSSFAREKTRFRGAKGKKASAIGLAIGRDEIELGCTYTSR